MLFLAGLFVGGKAKSRFAVNGALAGIVAALVTLPLLLRPVLAPSPGGGPAAPVLPLGATIAVWASELLKIAGGAADGAVAGRLARTRAAEGVAA